MLIPRFLVACAFLFLLALGRDPGWCRADPAAPPATQPAAVVGTPRGDKLLADYFRNETASLSEKCLAEIKTLDDWNARKDVYRQELAEMLGLWPMPQKSDLHATITATTDHPEFTVERLYFQSRPGLYVTANLYLPKGLAAPAPTILYVCGHGNIKEKGVSYGSKVFYQHHGEWFARNGYVCLTIDTLELGEIEGFHHGTYRLGWWWWQSRGYTPAGVEAWNGIRAIDYLATRPEVDMTRIGITGRSGGGAYSWYIAALDQRVKVACPVAGITDLQNHVVDGCVEGHCDCMYPINTYRWDFGQIAALVAPRALLIGNSDKDKIFPLEGVLRIHAQVRRIYALNGAADHLGLLITEGPHADTQDLQTPVFRWFDRFLKNDTGTIDKVAVKLLQPAQLKVFEQLPADQINAKIHESFVDAAAAPSLPQSAAAWEKRRDALIANLSAKCFAGWPEAAPLQAAKSFDRIRGDIRLRRFDFLSQHDVPLQLYVAQAANAAPKRVAMNVLDADGWRSFAAAMRAGFADDFRDENAPDADAAGFERMAGALRKNPLAIAWLAPRGVGPTAWSADAKKQTHILRRFALLGQTLDGMRAWDVRQGIAALESIPELKSLSLTLRAERRMAGVALYASLFEPAVRRLDLLELPHSHRDGLEFLNVLKFTDIPATVAMAADRREVHLYQADPEGWDYPLAVAEKLNWGKDRVKIEPVGEFGESAEN